MEGGSAPFLFYLRRSNAWRMYVIYNISGFASAFCVACASITISAVGMASAGPLLMSEQKKRAFVGSILHDH
jgi:hypothetical protein